MVLLFGLAGFWSFKFLGPPPPTATTSLPSFGGPFDLTTHKGTIFTSENLTGKPFLVFFGFTNCPDVCPTTLLELSSLMKELGPDADRIVPLFVTVDPERDTQEILAQYMTAFDDRIIGLRGTHEQTDAAVRAFKAIYRKVPLEDGTYSVEHTARVLLMDAQGDFFGTLDMHEPRASQIAKLRRLVK